MMLYKHVFLLPLQCMLMMCFAHSLQTAEWLSTAPSVMEECGQLVLEPDQLKALLHFHQQQPGSTNTCKSSTTVSKKNIKHNLSCAKPASDSGWTQCAHVLEH